MLLFSTNRNPKRPEQFPFFFSFIFCRLLFFAFEIDSAAMENETRCRIEETVIDILKKSDLEDMTEFKVRIEAETRLGLDLSGDQCKCVVRNVVEAFLVSIREGDGQQQQQQQPEPAPEPEIVPKKELNDDGYTVICQLSNNRNVTVHDFKGSALVSIRQFYEKDGKQLPGSKGISLTTDQWSAFRSSVPAIEEAIMQMKRKMKRSEHDADKIGAVVDPTIGIPPGFPIETIRFDGKNYRVWARQMEFFLRHLKIDYVLFDRCPTAVPGPESSSGNAAQSKAAEQEWRSDDHTCHHIILNSLSDNLFHRYTEKTMSARELWKELKLLYNFDESTKRSQVKKYIEFRMVEEKSIFEQVEDLNSIADSIVSAGMQIDGDFHVSVIISKLPPSWRNVSAKLMHEERLSCVALLDRLRFEEQLRTQQNSHISRASFNPGGQHPASHHMPKMKDLKPQSLPLRNNVWKRDAKTILCLNCGKEGHVCRDCPSGK